MNLVWVSISLWGTFALPGQGYITIRKCARNPRKKTNYNIFSVKTFVRQTTAQWKPLNHITFKWNLYFLFLSIQGIHSSEGFGEEVINTCECKTDIINTKVFIVFRPWGLFNIFRFLWWQSWNGNCCLAEFGWI